MLYPTYAEIHLENLLYNLTRIKKKVSPSTVIPVVKADAYGHGALSVTKFLEENGFSLFAVARLHEALELRESGVSSPILIFGRLFPDDYRLIQNANIIVSIFCEEDISWIESSPLDTPINAHLKVDTGMGRVGVMPEKAAALFYSAQKCKKIKLQGIYSHFSTSDEKDKEFALLQLSRFKGLLSQLDHPPEMIHIANSGAILDLENSYFNAVRPGILMYGHYPSAETSESIQPKQVMTLKTRVMHIRELPENYPVSYGRKWYTPKRTRIAILPLGYADGIPRSLTNIGEVLINGKRYPMVGTITMDQIAVHIGTDNVKIGDEVIIWGDSDQGSIQVLEVAGKIGTIAYELTCGVTQRVKRIYITE